MPIYTVGRRRVIIGLLLSAALLLTLDLRGSPVLDTARDGFSRVMSPVDRAADVVTNPVQRSWNSYSHYDDLARENEVLRDQLDRQRGTQAAAEAAIIDYNKLLALDNLPSLAGIETTKAQVVGGATNNIDQTVEINKGSNNGVAVGMPVVNQAGLIGKITKVNATTSTVMMVTDPRYSIAVEIMGGTGASSVLDDAETVETTPSGNTVDENEQLAEGDTTTEAPPATGTTPADVFADEVDLPQFGDEPPPDGSTPPPTNEDGSEVEGSVPEGSVPEGSVPEGSVPAGDESAAEVPVEETTTTTTTEPPPLEKEFGELQGRGAGQPIQIRFLQDIPSLAVLEVGDLVETAGPEDSLSPPNIPVGRVINRANRPGVAGPLLEIELHADLDKLNFVRVVLFRPPSEAGQPAETGE